MSDNPFRQIPSVSRVLDALGKCRTSFPAETVTDAVRVELERVRNAVESGETPTIPLETIVQSVRLRLETEKKLRLRPVINATGIVLHTNLGRAPQAEAAARAAFDAARGYLNLELDLATGGRSSRQNPIREGLKRISGAESGTAVNNCAAATILALGTMARGREVLVSRGQLVEIGGSFRIPEILEVSGAILREVGTTNITRLADYSNAIGPNTGLILRVHASNYRIRGFTESTPLKELVELGRTHGIPVVDDLGSGLIHDLSPFGFAEEPIVSESIASGADLVLFSGDKLLGGPQAGLIVGKTEWIARIERNPFFRAVRLDKMVLASLEATLRIQAYPERAFAEIPVLKMLATPLAELRERSEQFAARLRTIRGLSVELLEDVSYVGGGSLPDQPMPTVVLALRFEHLGDEEFAARLRTGTPAVLARIKNGSVCIDLRTVLPQEEEQLLETLR